MYVCLRNSSYTTSNMIHLDLLITEPSLLLYKVTHMAISSPVCCMYVACGCDNSSDRQTFIAEAYLG